MEFFSGKYWFDFASVAQGKSNALRSETLRSVSHLGPPTYEFVHEVTGNIGLTFCKRQFREQKGECIGEKRDVCVGWDLWGHQA